MHIEGSILKNNKVMNQNWLVKILCRWMFVEPVPTGLKCMHVHIIICSIYERMKNNRVGLTSK